VSSFLTAHQHIIGYSSRCVECRFVFSQVVGMESFVKRPCSEETEDDILQQQDEFLKSKFSPSAQVVRVTRPGDKRKSKSADMSALEDFIAQGLVHVCFWMMQV